MKIVLPVGGGRFTEESLFLARSIDQNTDYGIISVFCSDEIDEFNEMHEEIEDLSKNSLEAEIPLEDYPHSFKIKALAKAEEITDEITVLLDSDIIIIDDFKLSENFELAAKPVDKGDQFWAKKESQSSWNNLFDKLDIQPELDRVESTVDRKEIRPYFNAGVVVTGKNTVLGKKWLEYTEEVFKSAEENKTFSDQVALSLMAHESDFEAIGEDLNYSLINYYSIPRGISIIHYHNENTLIRGFMTSKKFRVSSRNIGLSRKIYLHMLNPLNWKDWLMTYKYHLLVN